MQTYLLRGDNNNSYELRPGLNSVGRNPTNDFRVHDSSVSSFHCEISVSDAAITVRDLQSTNGTFIDGRQVQEATLAPNQTLRLGNVELKLEPLPVSIAIPELQVEQLPEDTKLEDGTDACLNHAGIPALFRCTKCNHFFCDACVRRVGLAGSTSMVFCSCDGKCETINVSPSKKKRSIFGRLTQTIRIFRK